MPASVNIVEILSDIESNVPVMDWRVAGVRIWPLIKMLIAKHAFSYTRGKGLVRFHRPSLAKRLAFLISTLAEELRPEAKTGDVYLLTYQTFRHYKVAGKWVNIFHDPLLEMTKGRGISVTAGEVQNVFEPRWPKLSATNSLTFDLLLSRVPFLHSKRARLALVELPDLLAKVDQLSPYVDAADLAAVKDELRSAVPYMFSMADRFARKMRGARLALLANYYSVSGLAFCLAANSLQIRSADISHGASGSEHYAYGTWRGSPEDGYELLPTDFLSRTEEDADALQGLIGPGSPYRKPIVVGDLASHAWRADINGIATEWRQKLLKSRRPDGRIEVLVATQDISGLPPLHMEAIKRLADECFFWVRIHPGYLSEAGEFQMPVEAKNFDVAGATEPPPFALLERVDVVLTESSSLADDARMWGVSSVVTHPFGRDLFARQIAAGEMTFADTVDSIVTAIKASKREPRRHEKAHGIVRAQRNAMVAFIEGVVGSNEEDR